MSYLHCLDVGCADASVIATDTATFLHYHDNTAEEVYRSDVGTVRFTF